MKKILAIILALTLCASLCACGKSESVLSVEKLISSIGSVSISSSDSIKKAEEAYNALSDEEKEKVGNYDILEKAKSDYENLGIILTVDNYEKYLDVTFDPHLVGPIDYAQMMGLDLTIGSYYYSGIETNVYVNGKSDNYDYNDVVVTVKYTGFYVPISAQNIKAINRGETTLEEYFVENMTDIDLTLTAYTDIIGGGSDTYLISMPSGFYVDGTLASLSYEVVDVSGIMTSAR